MRLLLTEIGLLDTKGQYAKIKVVQGSKKTKQIKANATGQKGEASSRKSPLTSNTVVLSKNHLLSTPSSSLLLTSDILATPISIKRDNRGSIALAHNQVFHIYTKNINI